MKVKLDAIIAEIAETLDTNLLRHDPNFAALPRFHRMHFLMACLARCDIAKAEKWSGGRVRRWRPSRSLEINLGVKKHGIRDELERIEAPIAFSTLADEFSEVLRTNREAVEEVAAYVLRRFGMCALGLLEYRGKKDGLFLFEKSSSKRIDVVDEDGNIADFVEKYGS